MDFIRQLLARTAESHPQFDLQIGGLGSFPNSKRPRVLWTGIHAPADLVSLQKNIEAGAVRLGYEKEERPFSPHLTLGRVRQNLDPQELQKIRSTLDTIQLGNIGCQSRLHPPVQKRPASRRLAVHEIIFRITTKP
jgi:RNA 2',3'-cyclic 3'-phosphodiesterase